MQQESQMNIFLVFFCWAYNVGGLVFEICEHRATTWTYWKIYGNAFGLLSIGTTYWCLFHVNYGVNFWFAFFFAGAFLVYHSVCVLFYGNDQINCHGVPSCVGCRSKPTDTVWIVNFVLVGVMAICNGIYLVTLAVLRSRTEFGLFAYAAAEMKTNGNVAMVPAALSFGAATPTAPGVAASPAYKFQAFLSTFRAIASIPAIFHLCVLVTMVWNFGNIGADTYMCHYREFRWQYIRIFGNAIGVLGLFGGYWILWHILFGFWYMIAFLMCFVTAGFHLATIITFAQMSTDCIHNIPCEGCGTHGRHDWAFILNFALVAASMGLCFVYMIVILVLRTRVNWSLWMEVADEINYDPTIGQVVNYQAGSFAAGLPSWAGGYGTPATSPQMVKIMGTNINGNAQYLPVPQVTGVQFRHRISSSTSAPPPVGREVGIVSCNNLNAILNPPSVHSSSSVLTVTPKHNVQ